MDLHWARQALTLFPERALLWRDAAALVIADPHFGKAAAFRAGGVPVPSGTTADDVARLEELVARTGVRRLLILGDFFHARAGRAPGTLAQLAAWRARDPGLTVELVAGNHDRHAGAPPQDWGIRLHEEPLREAPFVFCHEAPARVPRGWVALAGHVHPFASLEDRTGRLRAPCFIFGERRAILPAFGTFTGGMGVELCPGDRVYIAGGDEVIPIR